MCAHRSGGRGWTVESHLCNCVIHDLLVRHIALVSDEELVDTLSGVSVDLLQPLLHVVERIHVGDIVDDADAVGTSVVGGGDGSETLLSCGVPLCGGKSLLAAISGASAGVVVGDGLWLAHNLQLHRLAIELDRSDFLPTCQRDDIWMR